METIDIIYEIAHNHPEIDSFYFCPLQCQRLLQERISLREDEEMQYKKALDFRRRMKLPFWDCIMLTAFDNPNYSSAIFDAVLLHNSNNDLGPLKVDAELRQNLLHLRNKQVGWNSFVKLKNGVIMQIPLFDFHIPVSDINIRIVEEVLKRLNLTGGYILNSGESYHYIHSSYISGGEFTECLIKSLFFSPIVDRLWVAHQLLNKSATLRIGQKHGIFPQVIGRNGYK